jgi:hypothetical protein
MHRSTKAESRLVNDLHYCVEPVPLSWWYYYKKLEERNKLKQKIMLNMQAYNKERRIKHTLKT